ncbi:MAG: hypothetical protein A2X25_14740 [Chloroflexi bacterium GWB2_49_20]|nr:MAG: hypothetical protein A2X25_14740 [Chloroflexi bacterium GWB2_49_20]OGN79193.1 MAG: hypothetical protein A2X26_03720 [Chloroflexi bacterium GWC2_49_37]OGN83550.1 MAG: hypothetical protein A2X27_11365 [Chloroflexi bacterium GWD2_49_16]HCC78699.1 hypothetical protein [Anaerolineae bacterium]
MDFDPSQTWYHGASLELTTILKGSTITQKRELARIFSHKPTLVSVSDDERVKHNGTIPGYLYAIAEKIEPGDVTPHPCTTMSPGDEWLTTREVRVRLLCPTEPVPEEQLTDTELAQLQELLMARSEE